MIAVAAGVARNVRLTEFYAGEPVVVSAWMRELFLLFGFATSAPLRTPLVTTSAPLFTPLVATFASLLTPLRHSSRRSVPGLRPSPEPQHLLPLAPWLALRSPTRQLVLEGKTLSAVRSSPICFFPSCHSPGCSTSPATHQRLVCMNVH